MDNLTVGPGLVLPDLIHPRRLIGGRLFDFSREVAVMAIINRTPDSFYDNGSTFALDEAVKAAASATTATTGMRCLMFIVLSPSTLSQVPIRVLAPRNCSSALLTCSAWVQAIA